MTKLPPLKIPTLSRVPQFAIYLCIVSLVTVSSCSSTSSPEPEGELDAKEIKAKTKSSLDLPELELFSNAKRQYQSGLYSVSRESFGAIKDNYPTGPYAEYSELKVADTHFENADYHSAGLAYEEFTKNRPASSALAYALLRAGRSFELSSAGIGRDPTPLQKALELYSSQIERFPNSVYTPAAKYYKRGVEELLASYEEQVIDFYAARNKLEAAEARDLEFQKRFGSNSSEFETSVYNKKAPLAVGPLSQDKILAAKQALNELPPVKAAVVAQSEAPSIAPLAQGKFQISAVSCDPTEKLVALSLDPKPQNALANLEVIRKGDSIELKISDLTTLGEETKTYTCFSEGDMTISSSGLLTLRVQTDGASALYVDNPSRVIVTLGS